MDWIGEGVGVGGHVGCPVLADRQYSGRDRFMMSDLVPETPKELDEVLIGRQALHAFRLRFQHPRTKDWIEVEAPLALDIRRALEMLRIHRPKRFDDHVPCSHDVL